MINVLSIKESWRRYREVHLTYIFYSVGWNWRRSVKRNFLCILYNLFSHAFTYSQNRRNKHVQLTRILIEYTLCYLDIGQRRIPLTNGQSRGKNIHAYSCPRVSRSQWVLSILWQKHVIHNNIIHTYFSTDTADASSTQSHWHCHKPGLGQE